MHHMLAVYKQNMYAKIYTNALPFIKATILIIIHNYILLEK